MSNLEHYFENLLFYGKDVADNCNKNALCPGEQKAVEECADYVIYSLFCGREDFLEWESGSSQKQEDSDRTCKTCAVICQRLGCDIPACPSYEPFKEETS